MKILLVLGLLVFSQLTPKQTNKTNSGQGASQQLQGAGNPTVAPPPSHQPSSAPENKSSNAETDQPSWCERILAPVVSNWPVLIVAIWGILVAKGTLDKIGEQTEAAKTAADAALKQANHVAASERAWVIAEMNPLSRPNTRQPIFRIAPQLRNKGRTPAFILEMTSATIILPSGDPLPDIPFQYPEITKWERGGIPLAPEAEIGGEFFGTFPDEGAVLKGDLILWVFGYVKYRDAFMPETRETHYCFRWSPPSLSPPVGGFEVAGPETYHKTI